MTTEKQVEAMEKQLESILSKYEKMRYIVTIFIVDPEFSMEAIGVVRGNIARSMT